MEVAEIRRRAQRLQASGATAEALAVLESGADRISVVNPGAASRLLVDGSQLAFAVSGADRAVSVAERAVQLGSTVGGFDELAGTDPARRCPLVGRAIRGSPGELAARHCC